MIIKKVKIKNDLDEQIYVDKEDSKFMISSVIKKKLIVSQPKEEKSYILIKIIIDRIVEEEKREEVEKQLVDYGTELLTLSKTINKSLKSEEKVN